MLTTRPIRWFHLPDINLMFKTCEAIGESKYMSCKYVNLLIHFKYITWRSAPGLWIGNDSKNSALHMTWLVIKLFFFYFFKPFIKHYEAANDILDNFEICSTEAENFKQNTPHQNKSAKDGRGRLRKVLLQNSNIVIRLARENYE